jgi:hypothetical protein
MNIVARRSSAGRPGLLLMCFFIATGMCQADESSGVSVTIARFDHSGNDYTLVVHPAATDPPDPYMGTCERFEVRGTYGLLRGAAKNDAELSRPGHREALEFLQHAFIAGQVIELGWVGTGFVPVDSGNPCVVKSRALRLVKDENHARVLSYHDAVVPDSSSAR